MSGWYSQAIVHKVRFEDLIGPMGGGDFERQKALIVSCVRFLGLTINHARAEKIANNMHGFGHTFRIGKIGSWRSVFSPRITSLFKEHANHLLLELGYETDPDWR
jgi:hypothetical protein